MPSTWTTDEQVVFLKEELPKFHTAQRQERTPRYLKELMEQWFIRWPERDILFPDVGDAPLTSEENEKLAAAIATRKKQLKTWMYWNVAKEKRGSTRADTTWLKDAIKGKGSRSLQAIEVYQQRNKEKIEARVKAEIEEQGAKTKGERMSIRRRVVAEMWDKEDEDVVAEIKEETDKQKAKGRLDVTGKDSFGKLGEERTPEEYNNAIKALPSVLQSALQAVAEATGWVLFVGAAGPNPSDEGHMYMESFYFGPLTPMGYDFESSYEGFAEGFQKPFAKHAKQCYSEEVRKARTLRTSSKHDDQEEEIIIRTLSGDPLMTSEPCMDAHSTATDRLESDPSITNEPACVDAHSTATGRLAIGESDHTVDINIPGGLGAIDIDEISDNRNPGNVADRAPDLPVTPVPTVSLPLNPPPTAGVLLVSPPSPPLAPGGPSSPIENAFARLATAAASLAINNPPCHPVPGEESIDPILLDMVNHAPPTNYHLPGAVVGHELAALLTEYQGPRKKQPPSGKKRGRPRSNAENESTQPVSKKRTAARGTKAADEVGEPAVEGGRKRKARLNANGEEFERPKKRGKGSA